MLSLGQPLTRPTRLHRLRMVPAAHRRLLIEALAAETLIRIALWLLPARRVLRWSERAVERARTSAPGRPTAGRVVWAVTIASRKVPRSTCLTRALAARWLFARRGYPSTLRVGVLSAGGEFEAHAWLMMGNDVLVGGSTEGYQLLPDLSSALR